MDNATHLVSTTGDRLAALITRLEKLQDEDFPTKGSKGLVELFLKVSFYFSRTLQEHFEDIQKNRGSEKIIIRQIKMIGNKIGLLSSWLRFIESSKPDYTPITFARIIEKLSKKIHFNGEIIIRPQSRYNWEFREIVNEMKNILKEYTTLEFMGIFQDSPDFIVVLSFPNVEKDNLLLHTGLLIHEFGHYFDIVNNISAEVETSFNETELGELIDHQFTTLVPKPSEEEKYRVLRTLKISAKRRLQNLLFNWIQESLADLVAIHIGGPGAFFAFVDQAIMEPSLDDYTADERYPSFRLRLTKMLDELREMGFVKKKFKEWCKESKQEVSGLLEKELDKWEEVLGSPEKEIFSNETQRKQIEIVKESFLKVFPEVRDEVIRRLNEFENNTKTGILNFEITSFEAEVFPLLELINQGISPNEIIIREKIEEEGKSEPAKWASILNAAWLWTLVYSEKPKFHTEDHLVARGEQRNTMFLEIIRALERSELQQQFLAAKSRFGDF